MVENRKLQVTGGSTYIVSLPGRWVRENGMEKGSSVSISEEFNILKIRPENYVEKEVARTIELGEDLRNIVKPVENSLSPSQKNALIKSKISDLRKEIQSQINVQKFEYY